jgi:hypothetical protein
MNYAPIEEAYNVHHINKNTYMNYQNSKYDAKCIFCCFGNSIALMGNRDGGFLRQCLRCRKEFRANILTEPIQNYIKSTNHLKSTN